MTDKEILYISTIAQCNSITKAAEKLFISQPSLTQALHRIEADWGAELFLRTQGGLRLTKSGQVYLRAAKQMELLYHQMQREVGETSAQMRGKISLGITPFQGGILLPNFLTLYHNRFPGMKLSIVENTSAQLEQMIVNGRIDLAILHSPVSDYRLGYDTLYHEDFYLAVPKGNEKPAGPYGSDIPVISPDIMRKQSFILLSSSQRIRKISDDICASAGITPNVQYTTSNFMTSIGMTARGLGACFVPSSFAAFFAQSYSVDYFRFPAEWRASWDLVIAYGRNVLLPKPSLELIRVLRECIAAMPEVFL